VHAAYDPQLDRRVALKVLVAPRLDDDSTGTPVDTEGRLRLLREAKAIAKLSHPNVVAVHDAGEVDGRVFIAMEYVDGETLDAWLSARPAATRQWSDVVAMFLHAGRGLAAAHEAGTVHRDFKPQNVMVGGRRVRVVDWPGDGCCQATGAPSGDLPMGVGAPTMRFKGLTRTGALMGTPLYMAPEQMKGEPADERTDQFSFCVARYEGLYGERPFPSGTFAELSAALLTGRVRDRPERRTCHRGCAPWSCRTGAPARIGTVDASAL
jgi:serine/threonine protein kinase